MVEGNNFVVVLSLRISQDLDFRQNLVHRCRLLSLVLQLCRVDRKWRVSNCGYVVKAFLLQRAPNQPYVVVVRPFNRSSTAIGVFRVGCSPHDSTALVWHSNQCECMRECCVTVSIPARAKTPRPSTLRICITMVWMVYE